MRTMQERYAAVAKQLAEMEFLIKRTPRGYAVMFKGVCLSERIPDERLAEKVAGEISSTCIRISKQIGEYVTLVNSQAEQLSMNLFGGGGSGSEKNVVSGNIGIGPESGGGVPVDAGHGILDVQPSNAGDSN